jgi:hypothetical protein
MGWRAPRALLAAALLGGAGWVFAGPPPAWAPALPARAATVAGFLPPGWHIEQQLQTDLDGDGRRDSVLLLQPSAAGVEGARRSPPRVVAVLLHQTEGWRLAERNDRLVPQVDLSSQEDPLIDGELAEVPGGFRIGLGLAATMGSYQSATLRYSFRRDGGCFRLVRYERMELHRATLDTRDLIVDYLGGEVLHRSGNAQTEASVQRRERLASPPRLCLQDLDDAARFKPL